MGDSHGNILIADDGRVMRTVLSRKLSEKGYSVHESDGGLKAIEMIATGNFDLLVLDIIMPDLGGLEVLQRIRENLSPTELPVIMATANDESEDIVRAFELGANDYVTKPINFPVLLARIDTHLRLKRATEALQQKLDEKSAPRTP
jgi:DNA-binding response OmpR family regulator